MRSYRDNSNRSYDDYLRHQMTKTLDPERRVKWVEGGIEWEEKLNGFYEIFNRYNDMLSNCETALCLGARTGQEVVALQERGINTIGIDLVPYPPYVERGDIHELSYEDNKFDFVYTNIFDHSLHPDKFCSEMMRVLTPGGHILINLQIDTHQDIYTETVLDGSHDVVNLMEGMEVVVDNAIPQNVHAMNWELLFRKPE